MTTHSPIRSQAGHVLRVPAPKPPHPGMTWAELAKAEGHRAGVPASPIAGVPTPNDTSQEILRVMGVATEPMSVTEIADACGRPRTTIKNMVYWLRHAGKIRTVSNGRYARYEVAR